MSEAAAPPLAPPRLWIGPALVLAGGLCIGFAPIGLRLSDMGPQATAFWRYVFALPALLALLFIFERRLPARPNRYVFIAGTFFALDIALWHWALTLTTVANATFIVNLGNVCVGFAAWFVLKERPTANWGAAVMLAIAGAALLSQGGGAAGKADLRGDLLALGAACLVAGYMLGTKMARERLGPLDTLFWLTAAEAGVGGVIALLSGEAVWPAAPADWRAPRFLGLIAHVAGQGLIVAGLGRTPAAVAGIIVLIQPVAAAAV